MKKTIKTITVLLALLAVTIFTVFTTDAENELKFAPGIEGVSVVAKGSESTVTLTIDDDEKLSGDVILIAASSDKTTGKISAIATATYKKGVTSENSVSATVNTSGNDEVKYYLLNQSGGTQKNYPPVSPEAFKASVLPNALELSWKKANDDFDAISKYIIKADNMIIGEVDGGKTRYTAKDLEADVSHDFEIIAVDDAGFESTGAELSQVFPVSNEPVSSTFDLSAELTEDGDTVYTESELKIGTKINSWTIVDKDMWWNTSSGDGAYEEKEFGENIIKISRGSDKYFVVIFGENTKKNDTVNVTFDYWGSYRWQTGTVVYKNSADTKQEKTESVDFNKWKNLSYSVKTDFDLADYGYPGESGFVIVYKGSGSEYLWIKDLKVKNVGFAIGITADSTESSYVAEILPCGNELSAMHGNAISGNVYRDGNYGLGYQYKNVDGVDAFYLTQMYDENASASVEVAKGYLGFKVDTDKFPKSPTAAKSLYLITEYYDGSTGDMSTKEFEISYTAKSWNWANSSTTNVSMTGGNTWKTNVLALGDIYLGVSNNADSAAITYRIPTASNGYNKNGILIRRVILCDEIYKNYYTSSAYTSAVAAYEEYLAAVKKLNNVDRFANGVEINFNKSGANSTPDTEYWSDIETNGIALRCDSVNDSTDNSYRGLQYGQYGPENDKRWAVSTASYWGKRAETGRMSFMYFKVDGSYIDETPQDVEIEITYYDYADDNFKVPNRIVALNKNATSGGSKVDTFLSQTNTNTWKTATIRLEDAVFDKSDEGYGDFRLSLETSSSDVKQLIISDIKVRNITAKTQDARVSGATPTAYIAADSIAANYNTAEYGYRAEYGDRYGWGEKLDLGTALVNDRAVAGQSTKNFNFQGIYDRLKKGDYVLISFGHNDATQSNENIYVTVDEYKANLKNVINTVLSKGATPVLITSIPTYDPDNYTVNTNDSIDPYRAAAMQVAGECGIMGFDLYTAFKAELENLPAETAKSYYQNENDEEWHKRIHLTEAGAECVAELITDALWNSSKIIGLKDYLN